MSEKDKIDVVILCGGFGTRLNSVVSDRPKPMASVNGKPFLEYIVSHMASFGFKRFIFCVHHKAQIIKDHFSRYQKLNAVFSEEREPLGTGGAVKLSEKYLAGDRAIVLNGDSICPLDIDALLRSHEFGGGLATMAVVPTDDRSDVGFIEMTEEGRITSVTEKARSANAGYVNAGVYLFERNVFDLIPDGRSSLERDLFPELVNRGFYGYEAKCDMYDIGTPERFQCVQGKTDIFNPESINL